MELTLDTEHPEYDFHASFPRREMVSKGPCSVGLICKVLPVKPVMMECKIKHNTNNWKMLGDN